jgi:hypothetical protein
MRDADAAFQRRTGASGERSVHWLHASRRSERALLPFPEPVHFSVLRAAVGAVRPKTFTFLFKEKTNRKRVCGIFGAAMVGFAIVASAVEPKPVAPVVTAQEKRTRSDWAKAQSQVRAAEQRAKVAVAPAEKAEKARAQRRKPIRWHVRNKLSEIASLLPGSKPTSTPRLAVPNRKSCPRTWQKWTFPVSASGR